MCLMTCVHTFSAYTSLFFSLITFSLSKAINPDKYTWIEINEVKDKAKFKQEFELCRIRGLPLPKPKKVTTHMTKREICCMCVYMYIPLSYLHTYFHLLT